MARRKRNYTVRTGDTAATIAKQLGVDPQTLMQANTGVSNLRPGMVLGIPRPGNMAFSYGAGTQAGGAPIYPPATQPISAYMQPAGHGTPTDYTQPEVDRNTQIARNNMGTDYITEAARVAGNMPVAGLMKLGFFNMGGFWVRPAAPTADAGGTADVTLEQYQTALRDGTPDDYRKFAQDRLGSRSLVIDRVGGEAGDGGYNLATRRGPTGNITTTPISGATARHMARSSYGGGRKQYRKWRVRGGDAVSSGLTGDDRRKARDKANDNESSAAVGSAPRYQQQYGGYGGGGSYMPSVKKFARPGYLGLINWRI